MQIGIPETASRGQTKKSNKNLEKMSDSAVLPSITTNGAGQNQTSNPLHILPALAQAAAANGNSLLSTANTQALLQAAQAQSAKENGIPTSKPQAVVQATGDNSSNGSPAATSHPQIHTNAVAMIQNQTGNGMGANQTDYFRNCNVPNLINKWRRRHTWLFLKEGKMFCQV